MNKEIKEDFDLRLLDEEHRIYDHPSDSNVTCSCTGCSCLVILVIISIPIITFLFL